MKLIHCWLSINLFQININCINHCINPTIYKRVTRSNAVSQMCWCALIFRAGFLFELQLAFRYIPLSFKSHDRHNNESVECSEPSWSLAIMSEAWFDFVYWPWGEKEASLWKRNWLDIARSGDYLPKWGDVERMRYEIWKGIGLARTKWVNLSFMTIERRINRGKVTMTLSRFSVLNSLILTFGSFNPSQYIVPTMSLTTELSSLELCSNQTFNWWRTWLERATDEYHWSMETLEGME